MKHLIALLLVIAALACAPRAEAFSLSLEPSSQTITVGDSATYTLRVTDLADPFFFYTLDVLFDPSILAFKEASFTNALGDPNDSDTDTNLADLGLVGLVGFSSTGSLTGDFDLASLTFIGTSVGTSELLIGFNLFVGQDNATGEDIILDVDSISDAQANVVPEPSTLLLLGAGLAALGGAARRRRS